MTCTVKLVVVSVCKSFGKTEKVVDGLTETEIARREAERKAKEDNFQEWMK